MKKKPTKPTPNKGPDLAALHKRCAQEHGGICLKCPYDDPATKRSVFCAWLIGQNVKNALTGATQRSKK